MKKVIFLDIDGVLNTKWWYTQMDRNTPKDQYGYAFHPKANEREDCQPEGFRPFNVRKLTPNRFNNLYYNHYEDERTNTSPASGDEQGHL